MAVQPEVTDDLREPDFVLVEEAAAWLARLLADDTTDEDIADCRRWREQHPRHEQAWQRICQISGKFAKIPAAADGTQVLENARRSALSRRRLLQVAIIAGLGGTSAWYGLNRSQTGRGLLAQYRSGVGETRHLTLDDGTRLTLNTDTAVDVDFTPGLRRILLYHGELLINTGTESPRRDFVVDTDVGRLTALGTEFTVRQFSDHVNVAVIEGAVEIRAGRSGQTRRLDAGRQTNFDASRIAESAALAPGSTHWRDGVMVAERMPVADFVAEISRYRKGFVFYDQAVADLEVTGVFSIRDTDRALDSLADSLPVELVYRTSYWVKVVPRQVNS